MKKRIDMSLFYTTICDGAQIVLIAETKSPMQISFRILRNKLLRYERNIMSSHFFAMMSRMKYIQRWALMRNSYSENISEHSLEVSMIAHVLAVIGNKRLGKNLDANKAALIGIYHDSTEIITGDMPTPIKYYNTEVNDAFKAIENEAANQLLDLLPEDIKEEYLSIFIKEESEEYLWKLVKAADKLSALIKCIEEEKAGNNEFIKAKDSLTNALKTMQIKEAEIFIEDFFPSYSLTLDELK